MNYTEDQTQYITKKYIENPTRETVDRLALELEKTAKSIIGKLSREGVYKRQAYTTKMGLPPVTKTEIVSNIEHMLDLDCDDLKGLEKTPKLVLQKLEKVLESS